MYMTGNFYYGVIKVFGPFFLAIGILMLCFSFFGPPKSVVTNWILELERYIGNGFILVDQPLFTKNLAGENVNVVRCEDCRL